MTGQTQTVDPRRLVTEVSFRTLLEAYTAPYSLVDMGDGSDSFQCPKCGACPGDRGGAAYTLDMWRWTCWSCRFRGTRMVLETIVLEDSERLAALYELASESTRS